MCGAGVRNGACWAVPPTIGGALTMRRSVVAVAVLGLVAGGTGYVACGSSNSTNGNGGDGGQDGTADALGADSAGGGARFAGRRRAPPQRTRADTGSPGERGGSGGPGAGAGGGGAAPRRAACT